MASKFNTIKDAFEIIINVKFKFKLLISKH